MGGVTFRTCVRLYCGEMPPRRVSAGGAAEPTEEAST